MTVSIIYKSNMSIKSIAIKSMSSAMALEGENKVGALLFFTMLKRNRPQLILLTALLATACLFVTLQLGDVYRTTAILQFSPAGSQSINHDMRINRHITQLQQLNDSDSPLQQALKESRYRYQGQVPELYVSRVNRSYLIEISIESQQPARLAESLDMALTAYIAANADHITADKTPVPVWLKSKLSDVEIQIETLTRDINLLTQQINSNSNNNSNLADNLTLLHQRKIKLANYAAQYTDLQRVYQQILSVKQLSKYDLSLYQSTSEPVSVSGERNINIFAGVMFSWLLLCPIFFFSMSRLREKVTGIDDIKHKLHTPLIALTLASEQLNENDQILVANYAKNYFQQAFLLNRQLNQKKILTLTSIHPQEGATQTTWQLASAISNNKRIFIIDLNIAQNHHTLDWLKSSFYTQSIIFSTQSTVAPPCTSLKGRNKVYHSVVDNIHVMPLDQEWLQQSNTHDLQKLRSDLLKSMKNYDLILFDTPALNTSDAAMKVSQISDGTLLIIKPNTNSVGQIRKHMLALLKNYTPIDGVILNQAQVTMAIAKQLKIHPQTNG
jgi:Mrp family chromosome partitioning ATPase